MIVDERMITFINSMDAGHTPYLEKLEQEAKRILFPLFEGKCRVFEGVF